MRQIKHFPLTLLCVALIWYLCMFRAPSLPTLDSIVGFDKLVHITMYLGTCSVFWWEYFKSKRKYSTSLLYALGVVCPIMMSGCIELAQAYCTTYRSGDWADFLANSIGVLLALFVKCFLKKHY